MSLEKWLPTYQVQPKTKPKQETIIVEEICANPKCKKPIKPNDPRYRLNVKGKEKIYCAECARRKMLKAAPKAKREAYKHREETNGVH